MNRAPKLGCLFYSVESGSVFKAYELPAHPEQRSGEHICQLRELEDLAERHATIVHCTTLRPLQYK
jgi:hypothetical protein